MEIYKNVATGAVTGAAVGGSAAMFAWSIPTIFSTVAKGKFKLAAFSALPIPVGAYLGYKKYKDQNDPALGALIAGIGALSVAFFAMAAPFVFAVFNDDNGVRHLISIDGKADIVIEGLELMFMAVKFGLVSSALGAITSLANEIIVKPNRR